MKNSFSKQIAIIIVRNFQFLIGKPFIEPYTGCNVDSVEPLELPNGRYRVVVKHNAFAKNSIPEFFGYRNPTVDLFTYLEEVGIIYK